MKNGRAVVVAGVGLTRFDSYDGQKGRPKKEYYDLGSEAILKALDEAGMTWKEIQAAFCGSVYCGTASGHQTISNIGMTGIPIVNVENACSSGSSAFRLAYQMVAAEIYDVVLAAGFESMPRGFIRSTAWPEWQRFMGFNVQPAAYAMAAVRYMEETGATVEDFARVSVKNRRHGALNPNARFQKPVTLDEVFSSRMIAQPLRLLHACPLADGGAAVILCSKDKLKSKSKMVTVAASVLTSGTYGHVYGGGSVKIKTPDTITISAEQAWEMSGYGPEDMDVVQAYDTMAPGELWDLEKMGLCKKGEAPRLLREGFFDLGGKLPVNTDGGLLSRGHPLGATSLAQIIEIYRQIRGEAGPRQVPGAKIGLAHAMGAGPNSAVVILKR
ncbi:MAG: thiolase family protein [Deltaproteobacteria bacterium]|nr:thiolase family protein [Deltaproteobacteria bacterium]MBW2349085.1 thiolase family protein [Deltaproteobacteria bacterium]